MEITVWVAVAVMVMANGQEFHAADERQVFQTEAACMEQQELARPLILEPPTPIAYGLGCAKVVVSDVVAAPKKSEKPAAPKADDSTRGIDGKNYI